MKTLSSSGFTSTRKPSGFSLIEVCVALAIIAVAFISIVGFLGSGVTNNIQNKGQTLATNIAYSIINDIKATPSSLTTSSRYKLLLTTGSIVTPPIPAGTTPIKLYFDDDGSPSTPATPTTAGANSQYIANVYLIQTGSLPTGVLTQRSNLVRVLVQWPINGVKPTGFVEVVTQVLSSN